MKRPYATARQLSALHRQLSSDQWAVLGDVAAMRLAVATDLQQLQQLRRPVSTRQFRRLLVGLTELGILDRLERRIGGLRAGSAGYVYGLGLAGQRLVAPHPTGRARRPWTPRPTWLNHALAVSHLYVELRQAEAAERLKLRHFAAEPDCWRRFTEAYGQTTVLKPDAYVAFDTTTYEHQAFIEVDQGTESPVTLARKLDVYRRYWQSGQVPGDLFPRVLWFVPGERRRAVLVDVATHQPPESWALHQIALYANALAALIEEPP